MADVQLWMMCSLFSSFSLLRPSQAQVTTQALLRLLRLVCRREFISQCTHRVVLGYTLGGSGRESREQAA
jgi:hypothetical protein